MEEKKSRGFKEGEGVGTRARPRWASAGAFWLMVLFLHAACATRAPAAGRGIAGRELALSSR